jgi:hypothetical protein
VNVDLAVVVMVTRCEPSTRVPTTVPVNNVPFEATTTSMTSSSPTRTADAPARSVPTIVSSELASVAEVIVGPWAAV